LVGTPFKKSWLCPCTHTNTHTHTQEYNSYCGNYNRKQLERKQVDVVLLLKTSCRHCAYGYKLINEFAETLATYKNRNKL